MTRESPKTDVKSPEVKTFREKWDEEVTRHHLKEMQELFDLGRSLGLPLPVLIPQPQPRRTNYMNWKAIAFKRPMEVLRVAQLQRKREHFIGQIFVEQGLERPAYYVVLDGGILRFTPTGDARILVPGDACLEQSVVRFYGAIDAQFGEQI